MYTEYFGLKENPFALSPDPRYLFLSQRHQDALAHLHYGITGGGGFVLLTGEVGTGKTLMIRALLQRLPQTVDLALVLYPFLTVREFMIALCDDLRIPRPAGDSLKALIDTLNAYLLDNHAKGRRTVLIVDEAHRLNREVLEQIRLLTNLETTKEKLLQIVLVGQPELNGLLAQPDMRQLAQRITARYDLKPLQSRETRAYVQHRCRVAGAQLALFSGPALWLVHRLTGGVPRLVNLLCDRALLAAYGRECRRVGMREVRAAAREVESGVARPRRRLLTALGIAALLVALGGVGVWRFAPEWRLWPVHTAGEATTAAPASMPATTEATPAGGGPATAATPTPAAGPPPAPTASLAQVLADPAIPTDTDTAFVGLFARWGLSYAQFEGASGCERAQQAGLRCLFESGTWNNLRQINRPAIIELIDDTGTRHHVLVAQLGPERVTLEFPGRRIEFPLVEVDGVWFGKYLTLWSPPEIGERTVRRGMRGAPVVWVRDVLARYGLPRQTVSGSELFDVELETQVKEFQRRHQLQDDGIVGKLTLVYLSTYDTNASSPLLTSAAEPVPAR
jgi:general secretion pathway protein A